MGVMLFPSFMLGNASAEGSAPLAPLSPFSFSLPSLSSLPLPFLSSSPLLFSPFSFSSFSSFFFLRLVLPKLLPSLFFFSSFPLLSFSSSFHSVFLLCPFCFLLLLSPLSGLFPFISISFFFFFLRELLVLNVSQDVIEGTTDCN